MPERVRLSMYCIGCLPGYHVPYVAAASDGLFAEHGLDVEILDPIPGPENVRRVATGGSEFCLTSVSHYLRARARFGDLAARFVAPIVRRHPIGGLVAAESSWRTPADLSGRRVGGSGDKALLAEYQAALRHLGLEPGVVVETSYADAPAALARGEIDALPDFVDLVPRTTQQAGIPVRAIHFGLDVYGHGLVAADRVPAETVARMIDAVAAALERQQQQPRTGFGAMAARYPEANLDFAEEGWRLGEGNIFTGEPVGSSTPEGWAATIAYTAAAHNVPAPPAETVYRPDAIRSPKVVVA
jgi:ABC-type nitrate/sulfonate/bicarbonate transport system substrate-binding protein